MSLKIRQYLALARNERRFRMKEQIIEELCESVANGDTKHLKWFPKLDNFYPLLYPSDVKEIKQTVKEFKVRSTT